MEWLIQTSGMSLVVALVGMPLELGSEVASMSMILRLMMGMTMVVAMVLSESLLLVALLMTPEQLLLSLPSL